jgi:hypothetical protein
LKAITTGGEEKIYPLVKKSGVEVLRAGLTSSSSSIREEAAWALGNIAGENKELREIVLKGGVMSFLSQIIIGGPEFALMKSCVWCMCMLCKDYSDQLLPLVSPAFKAISCLMKADTNASILIDASWALYYLMNENEARNKTIIELGLVQDLVRLLRKQERIALPCLRVLGLITVGKEEEVEEIIKANGLEALKELLASPSVSLRKESCWIISNIALGPLTYIKEIIRLEIMPIICKLILNDKHDVKEEAVWVVTNFASKMPAESVDYILNLGVINALNEMLSIKDQEILDIILKGFNYLLQKDQSEGRNKVAEKMNELNVAEKIEELQLHPNKNIYKLAIEILENYFVIEDVFDVIGKV